MLTWIRGCVVCPSARQTNSYHNSIHAADVAHAVHVFLVSHLIDLLGMRPLEVFAILVRTPIPVRVCCSSNTMRTTHVTCTPCWHTFCE